MKKILFIVAISLMCLSSVFSQSKRKWENTKTQNSISVYQDFINKYPDGKYTEEAKKNLANLKDLEEKRLAKLKEEEEKKKAEKQQKIKLAEEKMKNLKAGMTPNQVDAIVHFSRHYPSDLLKGMLMTGTLVSTCDLLGEDYIHVIFNLASEPAVLTKWYIEK
jgi:primosomal protein N'